VLHLPQLMSILEKGIKNEVLRFKIFAIGGFKIFWAEKTCPIKSRNQNKILFKNITANRVRRIVFSLHRKNALGRLYFV
jgi:hypothetical protein